MSRSETKAGLRERDLLYKLMISQLFYDGHQNLAISLSNAAKVTDACPPSDRLLNLISIAFKSEEGLHR